MPRTIRNSFFQCPIKSILTKQEYTAKNDKFLKKQKFLKNKKETITDYPPQTKQTAADRAVRACKSQTAQFRKSAKITCPIRCNTIN
jgi:hypothetical protein